MHLLSGLHRDALRKAALVILTAALALAWSVPAWALINPKFW